MNDKPGQPETAPTLRELFPDKSDGWLKEAEENLDCYLALSLRIFERIEKDPETMVRFDALTAALREFRMETQRSNHSTNPTSPTTT